MLNHWHHFRLITEPGPIIPPVGASHIGLALFGGGGMGSSFAGGGGGGGFAYGLFKNPHAGQPGALANIVFNYPSDRRDGPGIATSLGLSVTGGKGARSRIGGDGGTGSTQTCYGISCLAYNGGRGGDGANNKKRLISLYDIPGGGGGAGSFFGQGGDGGRVQDGHYMKRATGLITIGACGGGGFGGHGGVWFEDDLCYGGGGICDTLIKKEKHTDASIATGQSFFGPGGGGSAGQGAPATATHGGKGGAANFANLPLSPFLVMTQKHFSGYGGDGWGPGMATQGGPGGGGGAGGSIEGQIAAPGGHGGFGGGGGASPLLISLEVDPKDSDATIISDVNAPISTGGYGGFGGGGGAGPMGGLGGFGGGGGGSMRLDDLYRNPLSDALGGPAVAILYW